MNLRDIKTWIDTLPDEFLDFEIANGEIGMIDDQLQYRIDKPITSLTVDESTKEVVFLHDIIKKVKPNVAKLNTSKMN